MPESTAGQLALLGADVLVAVPLLLLLLPSNRRFIAKLFKEQRAASAREKARRKGPRHDGR